MSPFIARTGQGGNFAPRGLPPGQGGNFAPRGLPPGQGKPVPQFIPRSPNATPATPPPLPSSPAKFSPPPYRPPVPAPPKVQNLSPVVPLTGGGNFTQEYYRNFRNAQDAYKSQFGLVLREFDDPLLVPNSFGLSSQQQKELQSARNSINSGISQRGSEGPAWIPGSAPNPFPSAKWAQLSWREVHQGTGEVRIFQITVGGIRAIRQTPDEWDFHGNRFFRVQSLMPNGITWYTADAFLYYPGGYRGTYEIPLHVIFEGEPPIPYANFLAPQGQPGMTPPNEAARSRPNFVPKKIGGLLGQKLAPAIKPKVPPKIDPSKVKPSSPPKQPQNSPIPKRNPERERQITPFIPRNPKAIPAIPPSPNLPAPSPTIVPVPSTSPSTAPAPGVSPLKLPTPITPTQPLPLPTSIPIPKPPAAPRFIPSPAPSPLTALDEDTISRIATKVRQKVNCERNPNPNNNNCPTVGDVFDLLKNFVQNNDPCDDLIFEPIEISYKICDSNGSHKIITKTIQIPKNSTGSLENFIKELFKAISGVHDCSPILALPEWYQKKSTGNRPQAAVLLADADGKSFWTFHIPHYCKPKTFKPMLPSFVKGNFYAKLMLKDNSRVLIYAQNRSEAEKVINAVIPLINPAQLTNPPEITYGEKQGATKLVEKTVQAVRIMYYSTGLRNTKPDWIVYLDNNA